MKITQFEVSPRLGGGTHNGLTFTTVESASTPRGQMNGTAQSVSSLLPPGEGQDEGMVHKLNRPYVPLTPTLSRREGECRIGRIAAFRRLTGLFAPLRRSPNKPPALPGVS